jgi:signal transduction histidine kinase
MNTLRAVPFAQAWKGTFSFADMARVPEWQRLLMTLVLAMVIAVPFTVLGFVMYANGDGAWRNVPGWFEWYGRNLVVSISISLAIYLLYLLLHSWLGPARVKTWSYGRRRALFSLVPLVGVALGWPLGLWLLGTDLRLYLGLQDSNALPRTLLLMALVSFIFNAIFSAKARQLEAERHAAEARLQLLQAQIEPHFMFNTLANVQALIDVDAPKAKAMLESFTDYLRSSLGSLRTGQGRLATELELVQAYLSLLKTRMEDRLSYEIDADPTLGDARLPALCLQPLVENAIHHGLEPKLEGGHVVVRARREGASLVLEVSDDGLGLSAAKGRRKGSGLALANLRERLASAFGGAASLTLADAAPGTRVTLVVPLETA